MKTKLAVVMPFIISIAVIAPFPSCKKYEDGPALTFSSVKSRLAHVWRLEKQFTNGVEDPCDATCQTENQKSSMELKKDGTLILKVYYSALGVDDTYTGTWSLSSDKALITMIVDYPVIGKITDTGTILRLTKKEFWVEIVDGTTTEEYHYIAD